eukprot:3391429-Rhodomonas_salina.2
MQLQRGHTLSQYRTSPSSTRYPSTAPHRIAAYAIPVPHSAWHARRRRAAHTPSQYSHPSSGTTTSSIEVPLLCDPRCSRSGRLCEPLVLT